MSNTSFMSNTKGQVLTWNMKRAHVQRETAAVDGPEERVLPRRPMTGVSPRSPADRRRARLTQRVTIAQATALAVIAEARGVPVSWVVRLAIDDYLDRWQREHAVPDDRPVSDDELLRTWFGP